jgi:hypothetical protein
MPMQRAFMAFMAFDECSQRRTPSFIWLLCNNRALLLLLPSSNEMHNMIKLFHPGTRIVRTEKTSSCQQLCFQPPPLLSSEKSKRRRQFGLVRRS